MIQEIDLKIYEVFRDLSLRYFELYPRDENKALIFSAEVNINFGIQDINRLIHKINNKYDYSDSSWYYELISKGYQILNAFEVIEKNYKVLKSGYDQLYGPQNDKDGTNREEERQKIDYFRALRSLTTAHTLQTTSKSFKKFNITAKTYLEDVRHRKSYRFLQFDEEAEIILEIRRKTESTNDGLGDIEHLGIYIDKDIIDPVRIIISKFDIVNKKVEKLIRDEENRLRNKRIGNLEDINNKFLFNLRKAVIERYPREIEIVEYDDEIFVEFWEIQEMFDFVNWKYTFGDNRDLYLKELQDIRRKDLIQYAEKIQNMELNTEDDYELALGISLQGIDSYSHSKISGYLKWSKSFPELKEVVNLEDTIREASHINQSTNEEWGWLMLKKEEPKWKNIFQIDWKTSYRELYWQYIIALYARQKVNI